ncbi:PHP domain-containing protein [Nocardioides lacusdianchii]|uniref:PHP domain-containing protein n=1 Tax=Nocardioides lacusdianchii TaxID=2783664 RepID=UPI0027DFB793|nr:PHP domain-containing protein [Nocardioides lacusdianchii]
MRIDLHTHSAASDGTDTPGDLVRAAAAAGLDVVALTDHDAMSGWAEAGRAAEEVGITLVPGLEISTRLGHRGVHLLGYLPDPTYPPLVAALDRILAGRTERTPAIVAALRGHGIDITEDDVRREAGGSVAAGRPHVADALVRMGVARDRTQAFDDLLNPGRPGYANRYATPLEEMIGLVVAAGGVTVIAHPWGRSGRSVLDDAALARLKDLGLAGIEVDHQDHSPAERAECAASPATSTSPSPAAATTTGSARSTTTSACTRPTRSSTNGCCRWLPRRPPEVRVLDHDEIVRLYGPWLARTPQDAVDLMQGYDRPWWIAGGWAIEAYTGIARPHDDVDPSILRSDAQALREHLSGRLDVWQADSGTLRPLAPGEDLLSDECENLWLRPSGAQPWEYDVILMHATQTTWTFKRDARVSLPLAEILWERDGITYLRPEVQLLHKARAVRPKDQVDFEVCAPLLAPTARSWLQSSLELVDPGHRWLAALR